MTDSKLFQPIKVGDLTLNHRIVLAPLTRFKSTEKGHVPYTSVMKEYYSQRASDPGTLLITEATLITQKAGVFRNIPGIWTQEQIDAWKEITDAVHAKGSFIFCQLWGQGRAAYASDLKHEDASLEFVAPSAIKLSYTPETPRPLTLDEIYEYPKLFAQAAVNAVFKAGFDGVELNAVNGFLIDQFIQDVSNQRTDAYGGSIENRARFPLEVIDAVVDAVGAHRTAFRVSPWNTWQEMRMEDPIPTFSYLVAKIGQHHADLAYLHVIEPRVNGTETREDVPGAGESNDFIRELWAPRLLISAGGYTREDAMKVADEKGGLVAFGRYFISNPDLPKKLKKNLPLTPYNRSTFYLPGEVTEGYTDYPFASEE
ncbi:related to NADPH2 dehydrogenase chain OYE2 [Armillaria ostoyae]|uniref:Related to NADPH2 dehydrogenase chain OYE2 n=1 Tax=Armillaria ostoyae TaxID=47428 RepID=A0A284S9K2_ARMOS|nr:related to NADPH2 dehydrogenase chain OYE2 [Armillaria ostoyae]